MQNRRRNKLPLPEFQLRFGIAFAGVALCSIVLFALVVNVGLVEILGTNERGAVEVHDVPRTLLVCALTTAALALPISIAIGVITLFPVAGPIYKIEKHLKSFLEGNDLGACELRRGDRLTRLNFLVGRVLERVRLAESGARSGGPAGRSRADVEEPAAALPTVDVEQVADAGEPAHPDATH